MPKKYFAIKIKGENGAICSKQIEQLGTFTYPIGGIVERFVLTQETPIAPIKITHRDSTFSVCALSVNAISVCKYDKVMAAKHELGKLIERIGAERFHSAKIKALAEIGEKS